MAVDLHGTSPVTVPFKANDVALMLAGTRLIKLWHLWIYIALPIASCVNEFSVALPYRETSNSVPFPQPPRRFSRDSACPVVAPEPPCLSWTRPHSYTRSQAGRSPPGMPSPDCTDQLILILCFSVHWKPQRCSWWTSKNGKEEKNWSKNIRFSKIMMISIMILFEHGRVQLSLCFLILFGSLLQ